MKLVFAKSLAIFLASTMMHHAHAGTISLRGVNTDFIDDHAVDIERAMNSFDFPTAYPGTDVTIDLTFATGSHTDCGTGYFDSIREICARDDSEYPAGWIVKLGPMQWNGIRDIILNEDVTWCSGDEGPDSCSPGFSFHQTVMHALALSIGMEADSPDTTLALTMANYPYGGEAGWGGSGVHLTEWDYVELLGIHRDSTCDDDLGPRNFALTSYRETTAGNSVKSWQADNENTFDLSDNAWVSPAGPPADVRASIYTCPGFSFSSTITWSISQNGCDANGNAISPGYVVGTRSPSMSAGTPYTVGPNSWNFSGVPNLSRSYYMCVKIVGAGDTLSGDNVVVSTDHFMRVRP